MSTILSMGEVANSAEIYNKDGSKLDLYGKINGMHYFSNDKNNDGDKTFVRFGFKGESQLSEKLIGFGQWEYNVQANKTEGADSTDGTKTRLGFVGLKFSDFSSIDYGRNYGLLYDIESWTDVLPEFGKDTYTYTDNFMSTRSTGLATFRNNDLFGLVEGLKFSLQYQGKNDRDNLSKANGDGWGLSSTYDLSNTGFSIGAAYTNSNRTENQKRDTRGGNAEAWTFGLKYDSNDVYLAAMYAETHNMTPVGNTKIVGYQVANKTQNVELVAQYNFDFGLRPSLAFLQSKGKELNIGTDNYNDKILVKYIDISTNYHFNKNMSTYIDYKINLLNGNDDFYKRAGIGTDNIVATGLIYQF